MKLLLQESGAMVSDSVQKEATYELGKYIDIEPGDVFTYTKYCIHMKRKPHLYMRVCTKDGLLIPTMDINCNTNASIEKGGAVAMKAQIMTWFDRWHFALIQSSPECFWLVFDYLYDHMDVALHFLGKTDFIGQDTKYKNCARLQKQFVLRATPKHGFIPRVIKSNIINPETQEWLKEFEAYWSSDEVKEYVAIQAMNAL